jgi:hypothetical protein
MAAAAGRLALQGVPSMRGPAWCLSFAVALIGACVANDRSTRPPLTPPAPPQELISTAGFDAAMRIGSDYIYASQLPDRVFLGSQQLPGNLWLLRFGPGSKSARPVDLIIDTASGTVVKVSPAPDPAAELKATPAMPTQ